MRAIVTCREFAGFIDEWLDGRLPAAAREPFERHLIVCGNCARYLASYRQTIALGKQAFENLDAELPPDVPDELIDAILRARRRPSARS
jgi:anti-sigma factor RsiW